MTGRRSSALTPDLRARACEGMRVIITLLAASAVLAAGDQQIVSRSFHSSPIPELAWPGLAR